VSAVPGPNPQGTHHWVISAQWPDGPGRTINGTWRSTVTPKPGQTRAEIYEELRTYLMEAETGGVAPTIMFFALEPNQLGGDA
jgi:hypothetical protein